MKKLVLGIAVLLFSINSQAQIKDKKTETKTTIITKKDSEGEHTTVKKEIEKEVQNIEMKAESPNTLNIEMKETPVEVTKMTVITNPDGTTRTVHIDRSGLYEYNGNKFKLALDAMGYTLTFGNSKPALLRKTSTNSYIYRSKDKTAIGYFDTSGNLIVEIYNDKSDDVTIEKYTAIKE